MSPSPEALLRGAYAAFNARDADGLLALMTPDVEWPNGWEGGRVVGRDAVRAYWTRQWAAIDPNVEPVAFAPTADGMAVEVRQVVRDLDGTLLSDDLVRHVYVITGGLIRRMDIEEPEG
jgi:ketosteroid isomerase-like protein